MPQGIDERRDRAASIRALEGLGQRAGGARDPRMRFDGNWGRGVAPLLHVDGDDPYRRALQPADGPVAAAPQGLEPRKKQAF